MVIILVSVKCRESFHSCHSDPQPIVLGVYTEFAHLTDFSANGGTRKGHFGHGRYCYTLLLFRLLDIRCHSSKILILEYAYLYPNNEA